jgi:hypothetical protein
MVRSFLVAAVLLVVAPLGFCQNIYLDQLKDAYAKSGEIAWVNGSLEISPTMPCPLVLFLVGGSPKNPKFAPVAAPVSKVSADLRMIDETSFHDGQAFSGNDVGVYKKGDQGSLTIVLIKATSGKPFFITKYNLDKLNAVLKAGAKPLNGEEIGESSQYSDLISVIFESTADARKFETALKNAVIAAKAEPSTK